VGDYAITFARSARRELERLTAAWVKRVLPRIEALGSHPRPPGCVKLQARNDLWRIRVGEYRVLYRIDDEARLVDVIAVRHRGQAYR
jgi:mRNA interferase RelE/StbE